MDEKRKLDTGIYSSQTVNSDDVRIKYRCLPWGDKAKFKDYLSHQFGLSPATMSNKLGGQKKMTTLELRVINDILDTEIWKTT